MNIVKEIFEDLPTMEFMYLKIAEAMKRYDRRERPKKANIEGRRNRPAKLRHKAKRRGRGPQVKIADFNNSGVEEVYDRRKRPERTTRLNNNAKRRDDVKRTDFKRESTELREERWRAPDPPRSPSRAPPVFQWEESNKLRKMLEKNEWTHKNGIGARLQGHKLLVVANPKNRFDQKKKSQKTRKPNAVATSFCLHAST